MGPLVPPSLPFHLQKNYSFNQKKKKQTHFKSTNLLIHFQLWPQYIIKSEIFILRKLSGHGPLNFCTPPSSYLLKKK